MLHSTIMSGYTIVLVGIFFGILLSFILDKYSEKFGASVIGFTAGLLIAYICFEMLPVAFNLWGLYKSVFVILLGVIVSAFLETPIALLTKKIKDRETEKKYKIAILIAVGVVLHNIPEGLALGSMLNHDHKGGLKLAVLIALHCIPEICSVFVPIKKAKLIDLFLYGIIISIPILIGIIAGNIITIFSAVFVSACLSFSGGVMLYMICGEAVPESQNIWSGRFTTIMSCFGFMVGIIVIYSV